MLGRKRKRASLNFISRNISSWPYSKSDQEGDTGTAPTLAFRSSPTMNLKKLLIILIAKENLEMGVLELYVYHGKS